MFQPTWSQEASASHQLNPPEQDTNFPSQGMQFSQHMQHDGQQITHHPPSGHDPMFQGSSIPNPNAATSFESASYSYSIEQPQHAEHHHHYNMHMPQQHSHSSGTQIPPDTSLGHPHAMQSENPLYFDGSSMGFNNSGFDPSGQQPPHIQNDNFHTQQSGPHGSRPHTGSEQGWSDPNTASSDAHQQTLGAGPSAGLQRASRPAALKIDMGPLTPSALTPSGLHDPTASTGAEPGSAVTPHAFQTRFAPPSMHEGDHLQHHHQQHQQHSNTADQIAMNHTNMPSSSGLMPAFGTESGYQDDGSISNSDGRPRQDSEHVTNSPQIHQSEGYVGVPGLADKFGPSTSHLGVSASPRSPLIGGAHHSPSSTLSGAFSSRPGSRPASRGLKSVASFTSSAGTGTASGSDALSSRQRSGSGSVYDGRPISALTRTTSMQNNFASYPGNPSHPGLPQSRSVQNFGQMHSPALSGPLTSPRHPAFHGNEPWSPVQSQTTPPPTSFRAPYTGPGFQTPQMQPFSPTFTSPAQSQYSPQSHMGPHAGGMPPFFSPSVETTHRFTSSSVGQDGFEMAGFNEQHLSSALANSASISSGPQTAGHQRDGHSTPTIVEEEENPTHTGAMVPRQGQNDPRFDSAFSSQHPHHPLAFQHQQQFQNRHQHPHQHAHPLHHPQPHQSTQQYAAGAIPHVLQRSRSDQIQESPMDAPPTLRTQMPYPPSMRPSLYQQVSMSEMNQIRQIHGLGVSEGSLGDCSAFIEDYVRQYISTPSRLGLGERNVLIMTTRVAQKSYGAEKRFLCPPPLVILVGSSWWNACPASARPSPFSPAGPPGPDQPARTVLSPPRVTINISGEPGIQDGALEWASSSGRLIDVGNPSSEMAISGRCIGKQLYISDVDEKRRHVEALVAISVPGPSPMDRRLLGTFPSRPIKVISKPSKKRQSSRNTELCVNHGTVISLFHRLRSQTVSTRYLCVSGAPSWLKGSDNQPFLNMNPRDQKSSEPPSCFVAKMSSWDPFIVYLVDPKRRADATPSEPLPPPVKGYPPPPPNALPTAGLTSSQMTIHYNQPIVLQCLNTAVVSPVMVVRKVEKGTSVLGGAPAGSTDSIAREAFGDPVSQLHKIALEVLEDPRPTGEQPGEPASPGNSGPFLACLNESVGMHRPSEPRKWVTSSSSSLSMPSTPTTPMTSMSLAMEAAGVGSSDHLPMSPTTAAAHAAAQTRYSLAAARGGSMMSPSASSSLHDVSVMEPPPSSDGGKVKRPRRVSSSIVVQKERAAAAAAASKNRRRGQSLSISTMQQQGLSDVEILRRTGSYANSVASDSSAAGSSSASPGAMWSVDVADSDIWTVVGTDIARHSFYVPPQIVGGAHPQTNITDSNIAHLITVPAPAQPITPIPVITNVVPPPQDGRSPLPAPSSDQSPGLVTILGDNFHPNLFIFFGDWKSTHVEVRSRQTIICAAPPPLDQGLPRGQVPVLIVRHDGVIFPTDFQYHC